MAVAIPSHAKLHPGARWPAGLRWGLRVAGLLGCVAAIVVTPELVNRVLRSGQPLTPPGVESLVAYRCLAFAAGAALLVLADWAPRRVERRLPVIEPLALVIPLAVIAVCLLLKAAFGPENGTYAGLVTEDGVVEYATSLFYLGACALAAPVARGLLRRDERLLGLLWAGLAGALFFVAGEEVSWGQRLLRVPTPALLEANVQHEMNLHNLPTAQRFLHAAYIAVGVFAGLAWTLFEGRGPARLRALASWLVPSRSLLACFLPVAIFYAIFDFTPMSLRGPGQLRFGFVSQLDQEPAEMLLALGFLFFAAQAFARVQGWREASGQGR